MKVYLYPTKCNICGGNVIYTENDKIYGRRYGSGYCYFCTECGAYVGTHRPRPRQALGLLSNERMKKGKIACHEIFDRLWHNGVERKRLYAKLAGEMNIPVKECHFGYVDMEQLTQAYKILKSWEKRNESDINERTP